MRSRVLLLFAGYWLAGHAVVAQVLDSAADRPRFLMASAAGQPPGDASDAPVLRRRVTAALSHVPLGEALREVGRQVGVRFAVSPDMVPVDARVSLQVNGITLGAALYELLGGRGLDVQFSRDGRAAAIVRRGQVSVAGLAGTLVGRITDAKSNAALAGIEVFLEHARWRTTTDTAGRYRLRDVEAGTYTLTARRLGYAKQSREVTVREGRTDTVDMTMEPVATRLNELVTTATGRRRRLDIANDVTTINADSVMQVAPIRSVTDLLETRVPGLTVQHTSGAPGDPARLRLRGAGSALRNNDPIVIVDGIRVYAEQSASRNQNLARRGLLNADSAGGGYTTAVPSPLDYIDPNSIETIEVLKGPSAATLYGQDAANGVIVITTKKGKPGPAQWTASAEQGRTQLPGRYPDLTLRWGHDLLYSGKPVVCPATNLSAPRFPCAGDSMVTFQLLNDPALTVLGRGHRTALSLGVSGGTSSLTYAVTGSYSDELGILKLPSYEADRYQAQLGLAPPDWMRRPQDWKRWSITSNVTARLGAKADIAIQAGLSRSDQQKSSLQDQLGNLMSTYLDRASGIYYRGAFDASPYGGHVIANPITAYYERATDRATGFTNHVNASYRPRGWLTLTADAGLNVVQRSDEVLFPRGPAIAIDPQGNPTDTTGYVNDGQGSSVVSTVNLRGNALRALGHGFQLSFAMGANYTGTSTHDAAVGTAHLPPGVTLRGDTVNFYRPGETSDATFGWYVEPSIGNSKFNFSSGLRLDGGSNYGANVSGLQLPKFPKLGFSYLVSDEPWFPLKTLVQSLRVRVSYGRAGRQPGPKDRLRLYGRPFNGTVNGQSVVGVALASLGNTELHPEKSTELEGGFDADLWDSRVTLSATGYRKTTDDALLDVPVATSVYGKTSILKNIGVIRNTGLELDAAAQLVRSGPVLWETRISLSQRRSVVGSLGPNVAPFYTSPNPNGVGGGGIRVAAGYPLFGRWSTPIVGYADANGNGVIESSEVLLGDTAVYVGALDPNYAVDFSTTLALWHALTINAGFQYQDGLSQLNRVAKQLAVFSRGHQDPAASLAEQVAMIDLELLGSDYNWIQTVNTMRFNSLSVMYAAPGNVARRLGAQSLRLTLQGSNLALWTNYRGIDPNVNAFGTGNNVTDTGILPLPRTWQVRVDATY